MAVTGSGLFVSTFVGALGSTQLALDLDLETHKVALYQNTITPNFSEASAAYGAGAFASGEVSGTGYTAGGALLTTATFAESGASTGILKFDAADTSWASSTITNARCALVYADALAGNNAICLVDFGSDYSTSNGTFTIQWHSTGIFTWDLVP